MRWVAKACLVHRLGKLESLRGGSRRGPVLLPQLWCARKGIRCNWGRGTPISRHSCLRRVYLAPRHLGRSWLLLVRLWCRRGLEGIGGRTEHRNGAGCLNDGRKYLSHRKLHGVAVVKRSIVGRVSHGLGVGSDRGGRKISCGRQWC